MPTTENRIEYDYDSRSTKKLMGITSKNASMN